MNKVKFKAANKYYRLDSLQEVGSPGREKIRKYYESQQTLRLRAIKRWLIIIAIIIVGQSFLQMPFLSLQTIKIEGLKYVPTETIKAEAQKILDKPRLFVFHNSNYFLFQPYDLAATLENQYHLTNIQIKKKFPQTLQISATEKLSPFIRQTPDGYYALDFRGEVIGQISKPEPTNLVIADERADRSQNISLNYIEQATKLYENWPFKPEQLGIEKFHLADTADEMIISTNKGYRVFFTTAEDFAAQLARLQEILSQNAVPEQIEYIDLRFENNIYYK